MVQSKTTAPKGYGQFCPIALAAEVMAERWTPLVLRGLFCGARRFNEIQDSVPRMSSSLLSRRLKELEQAGVIERVPDGQGRGASYRLTRSGEEIFPVLETMGNWAQKWLRREITRDENLDPDVLMWDLRRTILNQAEPLTRRRVVRFQLDGAPIAKRFYWLVFEGEDVDICVQDPGHEVDLWVQASLKALVEIWLGHLPLKRAIESGRLQLDGPKKEIAAFSRWYGLSRFAAEGLRLLNSANR
ncbi:MAG: helix-turn-helix domain-containing protein [Kiloniellaceae bacterium]